MAQFLSPEMYTGASPPDPYRSEKSCQRKSGAVLSLLGILTSILRVSLGY
jgi:hypothetical protein